MKDRIIRAFLIEEAKLIKQLVMLEKRWIPTVKGHSLYIRPTIIGTRDCDSPSL